jgi:hypothetical protein
LSARYTIPLHFTQSSLRQMKWQARQVPCPDPRTHLLCRLHERDECSAAALLHLLPRLQPGLRHGRAHWQLNVSEAVVGASNLACELDS